MLAGLLWNQPKPVEAGLKPGMQNPVTSPFVLLLKDSTYLLYIVGGAVRQWPMQEIHLSHNMVQQRGLVLSVESRDRRKFSECVPLCCMD